MGIKFLYVSFAILALLIAAACGGDDDDGGNDGAATAATSGDDSGDDDAGDDDSGDDDDAGDDGGGFGSGTGTLTIGDETWEVTGVGCVFSAEEARNPDFPFNLAGSSTSDDGKSLHVAADIYDSSGEERHEGEGVIHSIEIYDLDFENQTLHWRAETPFLGGDDSTFVTVDGKNIHGVGVFDDQTTDEIEELPGTLDLVCP